MAVIYPESDNDDDPLFPWLLSIKKSLDQLESTTTNNSNSGFTDLEKLLLDCILTFKSDHRYRNDTRFLNICFLHMDVCKDYQSVFREIEENEICIGHSLLYEGYAFFLETRGKLFDALNVYHLGLSRNAEPVENLKKAQTLFLNRMTEIVNACPLQKMDVDESSKLGKLINPWSMSTIIDLTKKIHCRMMKFNGYNTTSKAYSGKVALSTLQKTSRNKVIQIGGTKYLIKGCAGQGGFAQVFKAYANCSPDDVVALKIQKPPFPWEFYMYRVLDNRVSKKERSSFGFSQELHHYSDYSILICDYLSHGTLQDVINSYAVIGQSMEEVLCIYYTIDMLLMLETLHSVGIIHGDFKPDNLLVRYARDDIAEEGFRDRTGPWQDQGLSLVDWGRGIDLNLFPEDTEFNGDCRTSGFRCIQMQEHTPWRYQVDTYGLCVVVHMMLHNTYMEIVKKASHDGGFVYQPKSPFKRYWNVELWKNLFTKLLNSSSHGKEDNLNLLQSLRIPFQDYICSSPQRIRTLKQLLAKQRSSLCSA